VLWRDKLSLSRFNGLRYHVSTNAPPYPRSRYSKERSVTLIAFQASMHQGEGFHVVETVHTSQAAWDMHKETGRPAAGKRMEAAVQRWGEGNQTSGFPR
jgi:hypothetical protein